jgi:hypothetical protein
VRKSPADPTPDKDYPEQGKFATKDVEALKAGALKRRLSSVGYALEDRASAVRALDRGDKLPGLFVRKTDPKPALDFRDHVAMDLVGGPAAILDHAGVILGWIETEGRGRAGKCEDGQTEHGTACQLQDIPPAKILTHRPLLRSTLTGMSITPALAAGQR